MFPYLSNLFISVCQSLQQYMQLQSQLCLLCGSLLIYSRLPQQRTPLLWMTAYTGMVWHCMFQLCSISASSRCSVWKSTATSNCSGVYPSSCMHCRTESSNSRTYAVMSSTPMGLAAWYVSLGMPHARALEVCVLLEGRNVTTCPAPHAPLLQTTTWEVTVAEQF